MSPSVRRASVRLVLGASAALLLTATLVHAQLFKLTREQLIEITADNPFERFADGRPKVPDALIEQAKGLSAEDVWAVLPGKNYRNQWADGFQVLHPGTKLAGRAFTAQFMPTRPDIMGALTANATKAGIASYTHQYAIDQLQPGDVFVADLFGKGAEGTIVGDNLFYYIMKATQQRRARRRRLGPRSRGAGDDADAGLLPPRASDAGPRGDADRHQHPGAHRRGHRQSRRPGLRRSRRRLLHPAVARAGACSIAPTRRTSTTSGRSRSSTKGKYKSQEIYGSPRDPALKKEYEAYLAKKLAELKAQRAQKK